MTTTLNTTETTPARTRAPYGRLLLVNLGATVAAGVAAEIWIGIVRAAGVDLRVGDPFGDASSRDDVADGSLCHVDRDVHGARYRARGRAQLEGHAGRRTPTSSLPAR